MKKDIKNVSEEDIKNALSKAIHPEINYSLIKLGMLKDIELKDGIVSTTLMLPFLEIPIKEDLINLIKESVKNQYKDIKIKIKIAVMDEKEKEKFLKLAREGWKV